MKTQTITIIGNIASGKSTLIPTLVDALGAYAVDADNLFQTDDPFAKPYLADMKRWAFANELWLTLARVRIMRNERHQKMSTVTVVDSGLLMSWVYTYSHYMVGTISKDEWDLYREVYDELTNGMFRSTIVVKLNYSIDTLMERLKKRGRDYELAFYTREYLGQIELGLNALKEKLLGHKVKLIEIEEKEIPNFEASEKQRNEIIKLVKKAL